MKKQAFIALALSFACGPVFAAAGTAALKGTTENTEKIEGQVLLEDTAEGLKVSAQIQNAPPGKHGFHIHEGDSCADEGKAAGGHFNPANVAHGLLSRDGHEHAHAGDMGNVEIAADGTGQAEVVLKGVTLSADNAVANRAIILHEKEDDFGQPTGNAGGRIACGLIQLTE